MSLPAGRRLLARSRPGLTFFVLFASTLSFSSLSFPQEEPSQASRDSQEGRIQFRSTVEAVNLSVVVTDKKGRFIPDLDADDFLVYENRVPQELAFFTAEVTPVTLLVLLDASTSVRESVDSIKEAAANFVSKLWEGDQ